MNNRQVDDNLRICKALVADNFNAHVATKGKHAPVTLEDVYVVTYSYMVTYSYTLGNFNHILERTEAPESNQNIQEDAA